MTPEDTPLKLLSNGYILTPREAPWSVDDRKWFAHNPVRSHRLRPLFPQEAEQSGWTDLSKKRGPDLRVTKLSKEQRHNLRVIVRQLEPGGVSVTYSISTQHSPTRATSNPSATRYLTAWPQAISRRRAKSRRRRWLTRPPKMERGRDRRRVSHPGAYRLHAAGIRRPLDWALAYAKAGMPVFPVGASKKPLTYHGVKDATTDEVQIRAWWTSWPRADPAWAVPANVVVVDLDRKRGDDGFKDFVAHEGAHPDDVATPQASTPTGGRRLVYAANGSTYRNNVRPNGLGLDLRTHGGYIALPGPGNGRTWLRPLTTPRWRMFLPGSPLRQPLEPASKAHSGRSPARRLSPARRSSESAWRLRKRQTAHKRRPSTRNVSASAA